MRCEATVEENGCITIKDPQAAASLGLKPGEHAPVNLELVSARPEEGPAETRDDRPWAALSQEERRQRVEKLRGICRRPGMKPLTLEDMDQAITDAMTEKYGRP